MRSSLELFLCLTGVKSGIQAQWDFKAMALHSPNAKASICKDIAASKVRNATAVN